MSQGIYTPCLHGFEPKVCPTCQEPILRYQSVADARRLAKALEVVEAARGFKQACEDFWRGIEPGVRAHADDLADIVTRRRDAIFAALAAFDEATK